MSTTDQVSFEFEQEDGELVVIRRCPLCQRFIRQGSVYVNGRGDVKLTGWTCKKHGEVRPDYGWF